MKYETVIGLEVHCELSTKTKAFCSCEQAFGGEENTRCCPVCMGLPGSLPRLNRKMVEYAVKMGLATNCKIRKESFMARKNYFYPDLPKGYQISQKDAPICYDGFVEINGRKIRIKEIHIEEDAGKLVHEGDVTKVDYNRAGVPLIEIVTEPDLRSAEEAKSFLEEIRKILLYLEISDCKMQEGSLRCDVNVSVRKEGEEYGERCEMKNINSFSAMVRCIEYEEIRQKDLCDKGFEVSRETRRWSDSEGKSYLLRSKEDLGDYRYFTEPDLLKICLTEAELKRIEAEIPPLPQERRRKYREEYSLNSEAAELIASTKAFAELFEEAVRLGAEPKRTADRIIGDISQIIHEKGLDAKEIPFTGKELKEVVELIGKNVISVTVAKEVIRLMFESEATLFEIVKENNFTQISDENLLKKLVDETMEENPGSVSDYKRGKTNALGYIVGQCMKKSGGKGNPREITRLVKTALEEE